MCPRGRGFLEYIHPHGKGSIESTIGYAPSWGCNMLGISRWLRPAPPPRCSDMTSIITASRAKRSLPWSGGSFLRGLGSLWGRLEAKCHAKTAPRRHFGGLGHPRGSQGTPQRPHKRPNVKKHVFWNFLLPHFGCHFRWFSAPVASKRCPKCICFPTCVL